MKTTLPVISPVSGEAIAQVELGGAAEVDSGPSVKPSISLTPEAVVKAQFRALARGTVQNRDGVSGLEDAFQFVSPPIVEQYKLDKEKYRSILSGPSMCHLL